MPTYRITRCCILTEAAEIEADTPEDAVEFADSDNIWDTVGVEIEDQWIEELRQ